MLKPPVDRIPAAIPVVAFVTGLAFAPLLRGGHPVAGTMAIACLCFFLRHRYRSAVVLSCLFLSAGLVIHSRTQAERLRSIHASPASGRNCSIRVPIGAGWIVDRAGGWRLRAPHFILDGSARPQTIDAPVLVILRTEPVAVANQKNVLLEGYLQLDEERREWRMIVKSSRLASYEGRLSRWHPTSWNRSVQRSLAVVEAAYPERRTVLAMIAALVLGDASRLPRDVQQIYRRSGTYHLLVFSGMQITMFAACIVFFFRVLHSPRVGDWILLSISVIAPLFAGDAPAVSRASWMIGLYALSRILHRPTTTENLYFVSALLRLAVFPDELRDGGFALTYAATGGLIFLGKPLSRVLPGPVGSVLAFGLGAELAIAPLTLLYFNQLALSGPFLTALIAPLFTVMLMLGMAICAASMIDPSWTSVPLAILQVLHDATMTLQAWIGDHVQAIILGPAPPLLIVTGAYFAAVLLIAISRRRAPVVLILAFSTVSAFRPMPAIPSGTMEVHVLDVGQGDAILLRSSDRTMLIDGGGYRDDADFGRRVLIPLLLARGVRQLDLVALSHPHPDHCGGLTGLIEIFPVRTLMLSPRHISTSCGGDLLSNALRKGVGVVSARDGMALSDPFPLKIWQSRMRFKRASENNDSVLYRVRHGRRSLLLTGDLEKESEQILLREGTFELRSDILKVGHHGSRFSTTEEFLAAVLPRIAVISAGSRNSFGHPSTEVLNRLRGERVSVCRTDISGNIDLRLQSNHIFIHREIDTR